jgi:hypothetical protein
MFSGLRLARDADLNRPVPQALLVSIDVKDARYD